MLRWIAAFLFVGFQAQAMECNGHDYLCDRRFDQVTFATTHNAMAFTHGKHRTFFVPNQDYPIRNQLADGVRGFMVDIYYKNGQIYTCHALCWLGGAPLADTLAMFKEFLDANPHEVVSIIFESYVKAEDAQVEFLKAGLIDRVWSQPLHAPWATLREMITARKNMVIFTEDRDSPLSWYHPIFTYAVETNFSVKYNKQFNCKFNRGNPASPLFILNHFLTHAFFRKAWNRKPNKLKHLLSHANNCESETGKHPNFLAVDFYRTGHLLEAVDILNRQYEPEGMLISQNQN